MAFKTSKSKNKDERVYINLEAVGAQVTNVRQISDNCIVFTLRCNGFSFYNMKLCQTKDGEEFITGSQSKGDNGKWYNDYAVYISEKDQQIIRHAVLEAV